MWINHCSDLGIDAIPSQVCKMCSTPWYWLDCSTSQIARNSESGCRQQFEELEFKLVVTVDPATSIMNAQLVLPSDALWCGIYNMSLTLVKESNPEYELVQLEILPPIINIFPPEEDIIPRENEETWTEEINGRQMTFTSFTGPDTQTTMPLAIDYY
ncbi:hypothetical protein FA95DRAFT_1566804 [Auriscalpium vulgare]|uniref:Uncharacterized protein n=1 Tax=Auriscalpium vulgare TaxID=40419 RepID=A0ACB8R7I2_9AGAM|nr:hypothetical protein FA95DRAFT_1566804 [Auriscalpium vulgare]